MSALIAEKQYEPSASEQEAVVELLRGRIVDDATGVADGDICEGEPPRARYYLATLAPRPPDAAPDQVGQDRDANSSMGFEIEIERETELRIEVGCSVYYRVLPTYAQQMITLALRKSAGETSSRPTKGPAPRIPVRHVYERVAIPALTLTITVGTDAEALGGNDFGERFARASAQAVAHPRAFRRVKNIPLDALTDEATYEAFLAALPKDIPPPAWAAHVAVIPRRSRDGRLRASVLLVNDSVQPTLPTSRDATQQKQDDDRDHFLFRAQISVKASNGAIRPIMLDLGPDAYRYNGRLAAYALSCGVKAPGWEARTDVIPELVSVPAPSETTFRVEPIDSATIARATRYDLLAEDPIPLLQSFASDLQRYAGDSDLWSCESLDPKQRISLTVDHERAIAEARRFREGIRWLERDPRLLLAFRLANRTMSQMGEVTGKRNTAWRSFQLVAIVSELPSLAWREHPVSDFTPGLWGDASDRDPTNAATVVFFPTGGGKTETYLGMTACAMFYDRIRGKGYGITTICRFPLKVLTLNQCQRLVDFIVAGEQVRTAAEAEILRHSGASTVPFEVGLLIGSDDTPNRLSEGDWVAQLKDPAMLERTRVVDRCPFCHERAVKVKSPDEVSLRLDHVCAACKRRLPIVITDGEVYRYLPTLVVATIDKLAMIGLSDRFAIALGDVDCACDQHGFSRGGKCVERNVCYKQGGQVAPLSSPLVDASPTFEIVDELHLLTEELGAFDGHYETALAEVQQLLSARSRSDGRGVRMKVIATTATIKGEDRQVDHLFGLRSVVTPSVGPKLDETFYWRRDFASPMRNFLGIQPSHGKTAEMTVVRLLGVVHAAIQELKHLDPATSPQFAHMDRKRFGKLVELYRRTLTYTTSLVDLGKLHRSIPTQVDAYLLDRGHERIQFEMLYSGSSREGIGEVRRIVEDLERNDGTTDAVIATSSVSHGLDIDRLNIMLFNGMPKSISEYIQASSRVGRRVEGLVIIIYNPVRERDRSHFRYHGKFHEYLDRMVAPVAINRWSRFAGRRTFPGIFMAYVLQELNREWWDAGRAPKHLHQLEQMQQALDTSSISGGHAATVKRELVRFYDADRPEALELKAWLETTVDEVLARLRMAAPAVGGTRGGRFEYRGTADFMDTGYRPMISLRDVDAGVAFWPARGRA